MLFFNEVQELSAKQYIMDIAAEVSYLEMSLKAAWNQPWSLSSAPRMCTMWPNECAWLLSSCDQWTVSYAAEMTI